MGLLDGYSLMIVAKYFRSISDFMNIEMVNSKYRNTAARFHINPIPLTQKILKHFPRLESLNIWEECEETFGNNIFGTKQTTHTTDVTKLNFYRVIVWCKVTYSFYESRQPTNCIYKNISYGVDDRYTIDDPIALEVTSYDAECFGYEEVTSIEIPDKVTSLGEECFRQCSALSSIKLPNNLQNLSSFCFCECSALENLVIPKGVNHIGNGCFAKCVNLKRVSLPDEITEIPKGCFSECGALSEITIPSGVTRIEIYAFSECTSLKSAIVNDGIVEIGERAFVNCRNLKMAKFGKNVKIIERHAFEKCFSLKSIVLPTCVEEMGDCAFPPCTEVVKKYL
ncbi:hypothetical protein EIN_137040 [Entamoeba invadens IP1]|uniref:Leucine rich repeat containing protein BspA family protein n=1 Tax=Entamoeba invadens IP1 TaxID=370355 RepID=A0A0A1TXE4_ENTIV|nr:hypothetical protein EIN_137040 [Entamoeba invadens IP1]ELP85990.1 hypothetical protein EIN_137040 [Entamoeba invadens IP1]|eukprot:XP_004185336.1 hypothetical protein EIN_137040 [Entamoeba invadens IP1]